MIFCFIRKGNRSVDVILKYFLFFSSVCRGLNGVGSRNVCKLNIINLGYILGS